MKINTIIKACACSAALAFACEASAEVIAYWPFGAAGTADISGNGYSLVNDGVEIGTSAVFDGQQIAFNTAKGIDFGDARAMTIECFVRYERNKQTDWNGSMLFEMSENNNENELCACINADYRSDKAVSAWMISGGNLYNTKSSLAQLGDGEWHHLALVVNIDEASAACTELYVDGELGESAGMNYYILADYASGYSFPIEKFYIGYRGNGTLKLVGEIDDVKISDCALDPTQFMKLEDRSSTAIPTVESDTPVFFAVSAVGTDYDAARISYTLSSVGDGGAGCDVYARYALDGETIEMKVGEGVTEIGMYSFDINGLNPGVTYSIELRAVGKNGEGTISGDFTTIDVGLSVVKGDIENNWPRLSVNPEFVQSSRIAFYRANSRNGYYRRIAVLDAGETEYIDTLATYGRYWYKVARADANGVFGKPIDVAVSYTRERRLERVVGDETQLADGCKPFMVNLSPERVIDFSISRPVERAFDGTIYQLADGTYSLPGYFTASWAAVNPAIGIDFGEGRKVHVTRVVANYATDGSARADNYVCGANGSADDLYETVITGSAISGIWNTDMEGAWVEYVCNSDTGYRYVFLRDPDDSPAFWCGNVDEVKIYGWAEDDYPPETLPFVIIIR